MVQTMGNNRRGRTPGRPVTLMGKGRRYLHRCGFRGSSVALGKVPTGVEIGFKTDAFGSICWNTLPDTEDWFEVSNG